MLLVGKFLKNSAVYIFLDGDVMALFVTFLVGLGLGRGFLRTTDFPHMSDRGTPPGRGEAVGDPGETEPGIRRAVVAGAGCQAAFANAKNHDKPQGVFTFAQPLSGESGVTQPVDSGILHEIVRLIDLRRKVPDKVVVASKEYLLTYLEDHRHRLEEALMRFDADRLNMLYGQLASKVKYQLLRRVPARAAAAMGVGAAAATQPAAKVVAAGKAAKPAQTQTKATKPVTKKKGAKAVPAKKAAKAAPAKTSAKAAPAKKSAKAAPAKKSAKATPAKKRTKAAPAKRKPAVGKKKAGPAKKSSRTARPKKKARR